MCVLRRMRGGEARKGVSGAGGYFMGYYTIWLAPVKHNLVPFWEIGGLKSCLLAPPETGIAFFPPPRTATVGHTENCSRPRSAVGVPFPARASITPSECRQDCG